MGSVLLNAAALNFAPAKLVRCMCCGLVQILLTWCACCVRRRGFDTRTNQPVMTIPTEAPVQSIEVRHAQGGGCHGEGLHMARRGESCVRPVLQASFDGHHLTTAEGKVVRFFDISGSGVQQARARGSARVHACVRGCMRVGARGPPRLRPAWLCTAHVAHAPRGPRARRSRSTGCRAPTPSPPRTARRAAYLPRAGRTCGCCGCRGRAAWACLPARGAQ